VNHPNYIKQKKYLQTLKSTILLHSLFVLFLSKINHDWCWIIASSNEIYSQFLTKLLFVFRYHLNSFGAFRYESVEEKPPLPATITMCLHQGFCVEKASRWLKLPMEIMVWEKLEPMVVVLKTNIQVILPKIKHKPLH